jgi:hypothetical protein
MSETYSQGVKDLLNQAHDAYGRKDNTTGDAFLARANNLDLLEKQGSLKAGPDFNYGMTDMFRTNLTPGGDYVEAGLREGVNKTAGTHPTSFGQELTNLRGQEEMYRDQHPVLSALATAGGMTANPLNQKYLQWADRLIPAKGVLPRYTKYALQGFGLGAQEGFNTAQGDDGGVPTLTDLALNTGEHGLAGAALGMAAPAIVEGGGAAVNKIGQGVARLASFYSEPATQAARRGEMALRLDLADPGQPRFTGSTDDLLARANQRMANLGPDTVMADIGPQTRAEASGAARRLGPAMNEAQGLRDRHLAQGTRVQAAALRAAGIDDATQAQLAEAAAANPEGATTGEDLLRQRRAQGTQGLYLRAFSQDQPITSPDIQRLLAQPEAQAGLRAGANSLRRDYAITGIPVDPYVESIAADETGNELRTRVPSLRLIDAVRRGWSEELGNTGDAQVYDQRTGLLTKYGDDIRSMRALLVNETEDQLPKLANGRSAWMEATNEWRRLSAPINAMHTINEVVGNTLDKSDLTTRLIGSPFRREAVAGLGVTPEAQAQFMQEMRNEETKAMTKQVVSDNSVTALNQAVQREQDATPGGVSSWIQHPVANLGRKVDEWLTPTWDVSSGLAPMVSRDPAVQQAYLNSIRNRQTGTALTNQVMDRIRRINPVTSPQTWSPQFTPGNTYQVPGRPVLGFIPSNAQAYGPTPAPVVLPRRP